MEAIITDKALKGKNFAVIIDEAHNSQTGSTAAKLQAALGMSGQGKMSTMTVDELLNNCKNLGLARTISAISPLPVRRSTPL